MKNQRSKTTEYKGYEITFSNLKWTVLKLSVSYYDIEDCYTAINNDIKRIRQENDKRLLESQRKLF